MGNEGKQLAFRAVCIVAYFAVMLSLPGFVLISVLALAGAYWVSNAAVDLASKGAERVFPEGLCRGIPKRLSWVNQVP